MVLKSVTASGSQPTAMPFFWRQSLGTVGVLVLVDEGAAEVGVSRGEESMIRERDEELVMIDGLEPVPVGKGLKPVPVGKGLKPVPEPPVGPPVGPP